MRPGDLVRIKRASVGVPSNSLAMIVKIEKHLASDWAYKAEATLFKVLFLTDKVHPMLQQHYRRYWNQDLEVVSAKR